MTPVDWLSIAFWTAVLMSGFCVIGCLLFGVAWVFQRPLEWIAGLLDVVDAEGRRK